jgi:hypothetical protein
MGGHAWFNWREYLAEFAPMLVRKQVKAFIVNARARTRGLDAEAIFTRSPAPASTSSPLTASRQGPAGRGRPLDDSDVSTASRLKPISTRADCPPDDLKQAKPLPVWRTEARK